ncbi:hypothetical protein FRC10_009360 [Ceratobasidium sp. 414]|nr:hypothetical protein FRC10_009360 [Ceratobasidium sp. 414]
MIRYLARALRTPTSVSSASRVPKSAGWAAIRQLHQRRALEYPIEDGLGDFLTPEGLRVIAVDWQEGLLDRLNEEVKDTELQEQSVIQTVTSTAAQKSNSLAFMYASQALNNSFFLDNLKPPSGKSSHEDEISPALTDRIATDFGTVGHLKSTMSAAALGMSSSGWVWCVQDAYGALGVVPTFGHGTVLVRNRMYHSPFYTPVVGEASDPRTLPPTSPPPAASPASGATAPRVQGASGNKSRTPQMRLITTQIPAYNSRDILTRSLVIDFTKIGSVLNPLFCISVNEHAWVSSGYGVWGKEEYLKRFWSVLNWAKVSTTSDYWMSASVRQSM